MNEISQFYVLADIPPPFDNACTGLTPACPVSSNQVATLNSGIPLPDHYQGGVDVTFIVQVLNSANTVDACASIHGRIF